MLALILGWGWWGALGWLAWAVDWFVRAAAVALAVRNLWPRRPT